ncbi:uncharacterized protein LOC121975206 isoform X1 [Zingiber officinale]|uniref:uncharacterized protein LOC121975206 isoform X1 n=1 Tax=Zingiber officinale TaxID=94328 RepID=UPI001C4D4179|nr:uncharacterized protein LOC121975206 isoform X1 [Zingiber officinale]
MASKPFKLEETVAKKLALWHTRTFRPIMTHNELEPLMAAFGFVALPLAPTPQLPEGQQQQSAAVVWQEYASQSEAAVRGGGEGKGRRRASGAPPRPRLPYPRIDGLHLMAYKAFLLALEFYLGPNRVPNLFHVSDRLFFSRTMSLSRRLDRVFGKCYRPMKDCDMEDEGILVFRDGTLDHITRITISQYNDDEIEDNNNGGGGGRVNSMKETNLDDSIKNTYLVPLKDLFPTDNITSS